MPEEVAAAFSPLMADAYGRLLRVKADKSRRGKLNVQEHSQYVQQAILPILRAMALAGGHEATKAEPAAELLTQRYVANGFDSEKGPPVRAELSKAWAMMQGGDNGAVCVAGT